MLGRTIIAYRKHKGVQHYYIFQTILHDFKYELVCIGEGGRLGIAVALPLPSYMLISAQSRRFFPATMVVRQSTCVQFASFSPKLVECYAIFDGLRRQTQRSQPVAKLWQLWHNLNITEAMLDWLYVLIEHLVSTENQLQPVFCAAGAAVAAA